ncbi:helix-turn-helix domain-containing protein, partial [Rhizobium sp. TRM95111]|nr:helix-turn-helix domain-containing protein [Rhizobium alarense]
MDSLITAAARALATGDPLGALKRVALREDGPALALRGIAMAQLGDLARAKMLLKRAARTFGPKEAVARARCVVAEAEIALVSRDLAWPVKTLAHARAMLEAHDDHLNAAHARTLEARRLLLLGRLDQAEQAIGERRPDLLPPVTRVGQELVKAGIALRRLHTGSARTAVARAAEAALAADIPALLAEVDATRRVLDAPAACLVSQGEKRLLTLEAVEALMVSQALVVDACRNGIWQGSVQIALATRPVLFALARSLAEA